MFKIKKKQNQLYNIAYTIHFICYIYCMSYIAYSVYRYVYTIYTLIYYIYTTYILPADANYRRSAHAHSPPGRPPPDQSS